MTTDPSVRSEADTGRALLRYWFAKLGVLPLLLLLALIVFSLLSENFFTSQNLTNVLRQSTFLIIISLGQMIVLITGGFDLSVGATTALTSVITAQVMLRSLESSPDAIWLAIALGIVAGLLVGILVGATNGAGVAFAHVSPFIMTLGIASVVIGIALWRTAGVPVYGMPGEFSDLFGFGKWFGLGTSVWIMIAVVVGIGVLMSRARLGRYFYAIGSNETASRLSGIPVRKTLIKAYVLAGGLAALAGVLLTARLETGEANIGVAFPLESIAACVIGGVSLKGGIGRVSQVVLGALFIGLLRNGMNLARVQSYTQTLVLGALLIGAVMVDELRQRLAASDSE